MLPEHTPRRHQYEVIDIVVAGKHTCRLSTASHHQKRTLRILYSTDKNLVSSMSIARGNYTSSGNLPSARIDKPDPPEHLQTPHQLTIVGKVGRHPQRIRKAGCNDTSVYNDDNLNHPCHAHTNTIPCPYHKSHDSASAISHAGPWSIRRKVRNIRKARCGLCRKSM